MTAIPSNVQPPHQGLVLTDYPELQAYVEYAAGVQETGIAVTWNLATDAAFTTNLQSVTTAIRYASGQVAKQPVATRLNANVWYIRARSTDGAGNVSGWTGTNIFEVDHRPFVSDMSPSHGSMVSYGDGNLKFTWAFSDMDVSDVQTAYQVRAYHAGNDALLFDTGKVVSTIEQRTQAIAPANSTGYFYWQVRVWDFYDIDSPWSDQTLFQMGIHPTALVLSPDNNGVVNNPAPTIQWAFSTSNAPQATYASVAADFATYALLASGNASYTEVLADSLDQSGQTHYRITVTELPGNITTYDVGDTSFGGPYASIGGPHDSIGGPFLFDSGWLAGTASTYQIPAIVHLGSMYEVVVNVRDTSTFEGSSGPIRFTAAWPAPSEPLDVIADVSVVDDPAIGAVQLTWNAALTDPTFKEWRTYRRLAGTSNWEQTGTSTVKAGRGEVLDYLFMSGYTYEYGVSQVAFRYFNELSESPIKIVTVTPQSTKYWLIHGTDPTFNLTLSTVVSDSFTEEYEEFEDLIIGRGRRQEIGTRWGYSGSLTCHLRDMDSRGSSLELQEILAFKAGRVNAFLRVPFGHIWEVSIGNIAFSRMAGVGRREFGEVTIPYVEVFSSTTVVRADK